MVYQVVFLSFRWGFCVFSVFYCVLCAPMEAVWQYVPLSEPQSVRNIVNLCDIFCPNPRSLSSKKIAQSHPCVSLTTSEHFLPIFQTLPEDLFSVSINSIFYLGFVGCFLGFLSGLNMKKPRLF